MAILQNDLDKSDIENQWVEPEGLDDADESLEWENYPIDDILVRHEPRTVIDIVRRINSDRYIMDPDFQRDFVWDETKQSRLIESALMRIPLPVFYLAEQSDGRIVVVDGLQRLTTFKRYLGNEFSLKNIDRLGLNGKTFQQLSPKLQNRVEDTNLVLYLIDSKVPEGVKLDIFNRVNSGEPLTRQQMRNCIHVGNATKWLKVESKSEEFLTATGGSLNPKQMRDREVINRFCGFSLLGVSTYRADIDTFLALTLKRMNTISVEELKTLSRKFRMSMTNNSILFGRYAFRRHTSDFDRRSVINVALFDVFSTLLADYPSHVVEANSPLLREGFYKLMDMPEMREAISLGTNQTNRVLTRFALVSSMLKEVLPNAHED